MTKKTTARHNRPPSAARLNRWRVIMGALGPRGNDFEVTGRELIEMGLPVSYARYQSCWVPSSPTGQALLSFGWRARIYTHGKGRWGEDDKNAVRFWRLKPVEDDGLTDAQRADRDEYLVLATARLMKRFGVDQLVAYYEEHVGRKAPKLTEAYGKADLARDAALARLTAQREAA